jgi:hypothetical protein
MRVRLEAADLRLERQNWPPAINKIIGWALASIFGRVMPNAQWSGPGSRASKYVNHLSLAL